MGTYVNLKQHDPSVPAMVVFMLKPIETVNAIVELYCQICSQIVWK